MEKLLLADWRDRWVSASWADIASEVYFTQGVWKDLGILPFRRVPWWRDP